MRVKVIDITADANKCVVLIKGTYTPESWLWEFKDEDYELEEKEVVYKFSWTEKDKRALNYLQAVLASTWKNSKEEERKKATENRSRFSILIGKYIMISDDFRMEEPAILPTKKSRR